MATKKTLPCISDIKRIPLIKEMRKDSQIFDKHVEVLLKIEDYIFNLDCCPFLDHSKLCRDLKNLKISLKRMVLNQANSYDSCPQWEDFTKIDISYLILKSYNDLYILISEINLIAENENTHLCNEVADYHIEILTETYQLAA